MRTVHNRMHAHLNKLTLNETELCSCRTVPMATEHILQNYQNHADCRKHWWPKEILLRVKMYEGLLDVERTAAFMKKAYHLEKATATKYPQAHLHMQTSTLQHE